MAKDTTNNQQNGNYVLVQRSESDNNGSQASLRDYLDMFLVNLHWFAASVIVCLIVASLYLRITPVTYQRQAVMLVKDDNAKGRSQELQA